MLARGSVSIRLNSNGSNGDAQRLVTYFPGVTFGDMAVVDRSRRSAHVYAEEDSVCHVMSVDRFHDLAQIDPIIHTKILKNLLRMNAERLRRCNHEIKILKG